MQNSPSSYNKKEQHHGPVPKRTRIEGTAVNKAKINDDLKVAHPLSGSLTT